MRKLVLLLVLTVSCAMAQIGTPITSNSAFVEQANFNWSHNMQSCSGNDGILIAFFTIYNTSPTVTSATYNNVASSGAGTLKTGDPKIQYFYWLNPASGSHNVVGVLTGSGDPAGYGSGYSFCGVSQTTPIPDTSNSGPATTANPSVPITPSVASTWAVGVLYSTQNGGGIVCSGTYSVFRSNPNPNTLCINAVGPNTIGVPVTFTTSSGSHSFIGGALTIAPSSGSPATVEKHKVVSGGE